MLKNYEHLDLGDIQREEFVEFGTTIYCRIGLEVGQTGRFLASDPSEPDPIYSDEMQNIFDFGSVAEAWMEADKGRTHGNEVRIVVLDPKCGGVYKFEL